MPNKSRILVTGATGAVGPSIVEGLSSEGYQIRTLSLDPPPQGIWPDSVEVHIGDVTDTYTVRTAMEGIESVVHCAALLHLVNPPLSLRGLYEKVNVEGTAIVVKAAVEADVRRIVLFSTIAVYGNSGGRILTEDSPSHPETFYAKTKLDAEKIALDAKQSNGKPLGTVLRMGTIYGARIKGNYRKLLHALAKGRFVPLGDGTNRRTLVYEKDVANAVKLAMSHPLAAGQIYNLSDGHFHTMNEIIGTMCRALGRQVPRFALPIGPVRLVTGILEDSAKMLGVKSLLIRAMVDTYREDIAVDSSRIRSHLGFVPQYDLDYGWKETVKHMRLMGDL
jgi:UDP-glucose 4-epimerase